MGRILRTWQLTPSVAPGASFVYQAYDLAGNLISATNAAGVAISYSYDTAARVKTVTSSWNDATHPATLYSVDPTTGYFPSGALQKATLPNGLTEIAMYNSRLQPCRMEINSTAASLTACSGTVPGGNVLDFTYGFNLGISDDGNVASWSSVGNQTFTRSYVYDSLNRLSTLSDSATAQLCKGLSWGYDAWGNRPDQNVTAGTCGTFHAGPAGTNNRFGSPYVYDAAGNMTYDGIHNYTYDAENRVTQVDAGRTASYLYDPNGNRVTKKSGGSWTDYYYDSFGNVTAEHNPTSWPNEYVYAGSQLIAQYSGGTTYSFFKDHLGSTRLITKLDKSVYDSLDFMPFGEQLAGCSGTTHKFTGKERDSESNLDNFGARYMSSSMGRFMSPDPLVFSKQKIADAQQWNMYSYVQNHPLRFLDPTGMYICYGAADQCGSIRTALDNAQKAANNLNDGSKERKALEKITRFYGSENNKNGVNVKFSDLQGKAEANTGRHFAFGFIPTKSIDITFDLNKMSHDFSNRGDGSSEAAEDAGVVAHEGHNGLNIRANGVSRGFDATKADEVSAFFSHSYVNQGLRGKSAYDLWDPNWKPEEADANRERAIESLADKTARDECKDGGCK